MKSTIRFQLSAMMLLQYFIWSSWYVSLGTYLANSLKADGMQIGAAYSMMAIATIISPFFIGIIADRFFASQKLMALLHLGGAIVLYFITQVTDPALFKWVLLIYALLYAPTLALSNSIAFRQLKDIEKSFVGIRVFGNIGWILAGVSIDKIFHLTPDTMGFIFIMASGASLLLAILSITLPDSPPKAKEVGASVSSIIGKESFVLFKSRSFLVFFIASILVCIPLSFYYNFGNLFLTEVGMTDVTSKMALGQVSEAFFLILIPFFLKRWGIKWMIVVGMIAWVMRFLLFRYGDADVNTWMLYGGILLHGVCYDFFFVTGQIYTDKMADKKYRNAAQGMITMATYGLGMWIGSLLSGYVAGQATINVNVHQWDVIWLIPAAITFLVLLFFGSLFKEAKAEVKQVAIA